jgi:hypothetical protein
MAELPAFMHDAYGQALLIRGRRFLFGQLFRSVMSRSRVFVTFG